MSPLIPSRADHVGSFLRPRYLLEAREQFARKQIDAGQLRAVEDRGSIDNTRPSPTFGGMLNSFMMPGVAKLIASRSKPSSAFRNTVMVHTRICTPLMGAVASRLRGS